METRVARLPMLLLLLASILAWQPAAHADTTPPNYRPDAWIKLCGWGDTCEHAPPHSWRGDDVYNADGAHQTVNVGMEEGNDVRFWILLQNDGALADTLQVKGCGGNASYVVRVVNVGWLRQASWAPIITKPWKRGTASFDVPATGTPDNVAITLDIWAKTSTPNVRYTCRVVVTSAGDASVKDTLVAKMVTT
jgi:hypothetical protein